MMKKPQKRSILILPFPDWEHIYPTLQLASSLRSDGLDVSYLTIDSFAPAVSAVGARFFALTGEKYLLRTVNPYEGPQLTGDYEDRVEDETVHVFLDRIHGLQYDFLILDRCIALADGQRLIQEVGLHRAVTYHHDLLGWESADRDVLPVPTILFGIPSFEIPIYRFAGANNFHTQPSLCPNPALPSGEMAVADVLVDFSVASLNNDRLEDIFSSIARIAKRKAAITFAVTLNAPVGPAIREQLTTIANISVHATMNLRNSLHSAKLLISDGRPSVLKEGVAAAVATITLAISREQQRTAARLEWLRVGKGLRQEDSSFDFLDDAIDLTWAEEAGKRMLPLRAALQRAEISSPSRSFIHALLS